MSAVKAAAATFPGSKREYDPEIKEIANYIHNYNIQNKKHPRFQKSLIVHKKGGKVFYYKLHLLMSNIKLNL